ncbi:extensin [Iris pallida]|uniref:Extensin n=1 Tax=Iris pallida TaxID=29817 RepID=A0AAX6GJH5_IRIPA|nr:extensin [Iris pallida]
MVLLVSSAKDHRQV